MEYTKERKEIEKERKKKYLHCLLRVALILADQRLGHAYVIVLFLIQHDGELVVRPRVHTT